MTVERISLTPGEIRRCTLRALLGHAASRASADAVADGTAAAELAGVPSHGLAYVPVYCEHLQVGKVDGNVEPVTERVRPALVVTDGRAGFAHPAISQGFDLWRAKPELRAWRFGTPTIAACSATTPTSWPTKGWSG
jgi:(2R)-3-sulfolactate dehydrogenase (NADP+)